MSLRFDALNVKAYRPPSDPRDFPKGSFLRTKLGQKVLWTSEFHRYSHELEPYRHIGDGPIDTILKSLHRENRPLSATDDLLALASDAKGRCDASSSKLTNADRKLVEFIARYSTLPAWVDTEQLRRGQEVFIAYLPVASLSREYLYIIWVACTECCR